MRLITQKGIEQLIEQTLDERSFAERADLLSESMDKDSKIRGEMLFLPISATYIDPSGHCVVHLIGSSYAPTNYVYSSDEEQALIKKQRQRFGRQKQIFVSHETIFSYVVMDKKQRFFSYICGRPLLQSVIKKFIKHHLTEEANFRKTLDYYEGGVDPLKVVFASPALRTLSEGVLQELGFTLQAQPACS